MKGSPKLSLIRRALRGLRVNAGFVARIGWRWFSALEYAWHLVFWSRLASMRRRRKPIILTQRQLANKGVHVPAPTLTVTGLPEGEAFTEGFSGVYAYLFGNLQKPGLLASVRHVRPGPAFRGIYLWDSAFIARVWQDWDPAVSRDALRAVVEVRDGERLQHVCADLVKSPFTQPPLIGWSAVRAVTDAPPAQRVAFFEEVYPAIADFHRWLAENRCHENGLYFWKHAYESGMENAPRFSNTDETRLLDTRQQAAPDFAVYVTLQLEALETMARELNRPEDARAWRAERDHLAATVNAELWDEADGLYYDRDTATGDLIRCPTIASLLPLWAGIPDAARAARLVQWIERADGFGTPMPLPTVARGHPSFERDMWRGPVWLNTAYGVIEGLRRCGYDALAGKLAYRLCQCVYLVFHTERRFYEFYDPDLLHTLQLRRKQGNNWKALTLGTGPQTAFVGWTGLVNRLVVEVLFGLRVADGQLTLRPRFPIHAAGGSFTLTLPRHGAEVTLQPNADGSHGLSATIADVKYSKKIAVGDAWTAALPQPSVD